MTTPFCYFVTKFSSHLKREICKQEKYSLLTNCIIVGSVFIVACRHHLPRRRLPRMEVAERRSIHSPSASHINIGFRRNLPVYAENSMVSGRSSIFAGAYGRLLACQLLHGRCDTSRIEMKFIIIIILRLLLRKLVTLLFYTAFTSDSFIHIPCAIESDSRQIEWMLQRYGTSLPKMLGQEFEYLYSGSEMYKIWMYFSADFFHSDKTWNFSAFIVCIEFSSLLRR